MTRGRQVILGVVVGLGLAFVVIHGFDVEWSTMNLGVVSMICVSLSVALIELFGEPKPRR